MERPRRSVSALPGRSDRVDVITPVGVWQSDELDYTLHNPVVLHAVTVP